jgi:hypothetical protein
MERVVALGLELNDEVAAIEPPAELEDLHRRAVREARRSEPAFERLPDRLRDAGNPARVLQRELQLLRPQIERNVRLTRRLGLEDCTGSGLPGGDEQAPS